MSVGTIFGIRTSPNEIRYAILKMGNDGEIIFVNRTLENKLQYPVSLTTTDEKLKWLKVEMDRIFRQVPDINQMVIKTNEYAGSDNKSKRESTYAEAICILTSAEHNVPVICKLYSQLRTTSRNVRNYARDKVGQTPTYWDNKIADAVAAALCMMDC